MIAVCISFCDCKMNAILLVACHSRKQPKVKINKIITHTQYVIIRTKKKHTHMKWAYTNAQLVIEAVCDGELRRFQK